MSAPTARLADLRLVPSAIASWAVTASGIAWGAAPSAVVAGASAVCAAAVGWWGSGRGGLAETARAVVATVAAVAVVGAGFAVAAALRVQQAREHPITARYGAVSTVVVTPSETPRPVRGGRLMFRGGLQALDGLGTAGRVVVFAPAADFAELTAGRPVRFRARVSRPRRHDLTVAVLSATGRPALGTASAIQRGAARIRAGFTEAARAVLASDQAAMLPALVLGDTSAVPAPTGEQFRAAGLTHLTAVSGANVTIVCGSVLFTAALLGPRAAVALAALALVAFVVVVQPSASVLRAAVMGAISLLAILTHRRRQAFRCSRRA